MKICMYIPNGFSDKAKKSFLDAIPALGKSSYSIEEDALSCYLIECTGDVVSEAARNSISAILYTNMPYGREQHTAFGDGLCRQSAASFGKELAVTLVSKQSDDTTFARNGKLLAQHERSKENVLCHN